ncbi:MAG: hypothetical protein V4527_18395 [Pseudomonadota bacterium]
MAVDWRLGAPQGDAGTSFQQGYQNALVQRQQQEDRQLQMQQRDMQMQQAKQTQATQVTAQHQQMIRLGAGIARRINPTDDTSWQAVRQAYAQAGGDLTDVPEHFDPHYYQGLLAAGQTLDEQARRQAAPQGPTTLQRNDEYIRSQYGDPAGDQYVSRQVAPPPITQHNADGTITIIPQAGAPVHRRSQQQGGAFQDGDTEVIGGVTYVRQGGHWVPQPVAPQAADARPATDPAPAFHPDPNSIPSGNPLDPNLRRY